jgi:DNA-binding transcriptional LysR family regulator
VTLLDRTSRRVELTDAGRALLSEGRRLLAHSNRTTRLVLRLAERLTVGFYGSAASSLLPDLLRSFGEEHPTAEVSVRELLLDQLDELLAGGVDVAFTRLFITNPVVEASVPPKRWLAEQAHHGLPGRITAQAASIQEILTLVAAGSGVCLVPASVAQHYPGADVSYVEISDADAAVVSLAWPRGGLRPIVGAFIEVTTAANARRRRPEERHLLGF